MWLEDYQWHYDYVRLAWDTGFSFEKCKFPNLDKNKICVVDVDRIVKERDVASVDRYIATVVQYILEDEQAKVLDNNFVKIFRLSQLAVEYLLFCKKYLDNTVVLLKRELAKCGEENKELKSFTDELQSHIEALTRQQVSATFKCPSCTKMFSSENFLDAHIKRRHQTPENCNPETDQLNLEIKELKERLNNAEKLLKEKDEQKPEGDNDKSRILDVLENFDKLKTQVDSELKELKAQKSFYEENYGRLFELVIQNKENVEPSSQVKESTTQTDKVLRIENVNDKNVLQLQKNGNEVETDQSKLKGSLEAQISTTLAGIEGQMQAFWSKLNEIEHNQANNSAAPVGDGILVHEVKPKAKPRSKLSQPTHNTVPSDGNVEKLSKAIAALEEQERHEIVANKPNEDIKPDFSEGDNSESESTEEESESLGSSGEGSNKPVVSNIDKPINVRTSEGRSPTKHKERSVIKPIVESEQPLNYSKAPSQKSIAKSNKEVRLLISDRLQELGISTSWTRLPQRSFEKALEMVNHQATLTEQTYFSFDSIKRKLNLEVERQCNIKTGNRSNNPKRLKKLQNILRVSYKHKPPKANSSPKKDVIEIKNRALYDTDTEDEASSLQQPDPHRFYSKVVEELKSLPDPKAEELKDAQKGVLKSFPSNGSLSKKKVLFDLESESSKVEDLPVAQKTAATGGSTTSVASSILEDKAEEEGGEEFEELSDFDLSDV